MRRIKLKKKQDNTRRNAAIVFLILLTFSVVGYAIVNSFSNSSDQNDLNINSEGFIYDGNYWSVKIGEQAYYFENLPSSVSNVSISGNFSLGDYYNKPLYFVNDNGRSSEILNNIGRYVLRSQRACLDYENCSEDLPIKFCSLDNIIIFEDGENLIYKDQNCVYLRGGGLISSDKFLYELLKIN